MRDSFAEVSAVLFDLDGTLVDSAPDLGAAANSLRETQGLEALPLERYRFMAGVGARGMLDIAFGMKPDHADFAAMREAFFKLFAQRMNQATSVFPEIERLLSGVQAMGIPWGIVTNKAARFTDPLVACTSLLQSAGAVVSGDTTPYAKPHPAPLLEAARRMGVDPRRCLYVGDDVRDIDAGRAAGMRTVAAAWGYLGETASVTDWGADAVIRSPLELLLLLKSPKKD